VSPRLNRILEEMKKRREDGRYNTPMAAESGFREPVRKGEPAGAEAM
jgi:hypothetical protein